MQWHLSHDRCRTRRIGPGGLWGGDDDQQCLRDSLAEYEDCVEEIFSLLTEAVDPSESLIRGVDVYAIFVGDQIAADTLPVTNPYWLEAQEFLAETAAKYGIPTAQVFDEFMGPDGTEDSQRLTSCIRPNLVRSS